MSTQQEFTGILVSVTEPYRDGAPVILETKDRSYELVLGEKAKASVPYFVNTETDVIVFGELLPHDSDLYNQRIKAETIHEA